MDKNLKELMQITIVSENKLLSQMIENIVPIKEKRFTDIELDAVKKQEFSLVVYKKENILTRLFKAIQMSFEKIKIMRHSRKFEVNRNEIQ